MSMLFGSKCLMKIGSRMFGVELSSIRRQHFKTEACKIIDFDACSLSRDSEEGRLATLALAFTDAFSMDGIAVLKNHGIQSDKFRRTFGAAREFYRLPAEQRLPHAKLEENIIAYGYIPLAHKIKKYEVFESSRELFRYHPTIHNEILLNEFKEANASLFTDMSTLFKRVLKPLAVALDVGEKDLSEKFKHVGEAGNITQILHNLYPPAVMKDDNDSVKLGTHYDADMIGFLITSDESGLQFQNVSGDWVDVPPTKDDIIMIIGKQMEMWTEDKFKAAIHRVVPPANQLTTRQSCGFFVFADSGDAIQGIYGGDKYKPFYSDQIRIEVAKSRYKFT